MKVRYIYSACVVIETDDLKVCCDPWFTLGAYDGSWYQYPPLKKDPADVIGKVDFIYVSHIHPDHYDPGFLRKYLARFPDTKLIIGETKPPFLLEKMKIDGFSPRIVSEEKIEGTSFHIFVNQGYEVDNIDTALLVVDKHGLSAANLNDNPYDQNQVDQILAQCPSGYPTVALLPYAGAGPYPQTYYFATESDREKAIEKKKRQFLDLYSKYVSALKPQRAIPFAGKYFLAGALARLNDYRGIADATELLSKHGDVSVVLADGGEAYLDVSSLKASAVRKTPYDKKEIEQHLASVPFRGYAYELEIQPDKDRVLPILPLMKTAYAKAIKQTAVKETYWICVKPDGCRDYLIFDLAQDSGIKRAQEVAHLEPRCEIFLDPRYLFGLLSRLYHWNNAAIGSQYRSKRVPDVYNPHVYSFLNRFHV